MKDECLGKKKGVLYQLRPLAGLLMEDEFLGHWSWVAQQPEERECSPLASLHEVIWKVKVLKTKICHPEFLICYCMVQRPFMPGFLPLPNKGVHVTSELLLLWGVF